MKLLLVFAIGALFICSATSPLAAEPASEDLAVIVNADNRASVSASDLEGMFLRRVRGWSDGSSVIPFNASPEGASRRSFDRSVLGMSTDEVARYWLDQRIRSGLSAPREISDPALAVKLVARLKGAIAYVPVKTNIQSVRVIAWIKAGKFMSY